MPLRRRWRVTSWQGICHVLLRRPTAPSMKRSRARPLSLLAVISACHAENPVRPPPNGVDTVAMSSLTASLPLGQTAQLIATPMDARGHVLPGRTIAWSSSDSSVAIVSTAGLASNTSGFVTSVGLGTATISAATEGKRGTTLVSVTQPAAGVSHYVDAVAGNDTNPGTSAAPWQTIQHAADVLPPGDTAIVNDGVYTGAGNVVTIARSGAPSAWLVLRAARPGGAVIDGRNATSTTGIEITGSYVRVEGFDVRNTLRYGIDAELGHDVVVSQNVIHDVGRICTDSKDGIVGVDAYDRNLVIERNVIHDIGRLGAGEQGCQPTNTYWQNHDHAVYHGVGDNVVIRNNVFYNLVHGWAIQRFDSAGTDVNGLTIANNTFVGTNPWRPGHIIVATATTNLLIANNVFYNPNTAGVWFDTGSLMNTILSNNLTMGGPVSTGDSATVAYAGNLNNTDPLFVNAAAFDFRVQAASPAIGAGLRLAIVPDDADGVARPATVYTIGAYQYH